MKTFLRISLTATALVLAVCGMEPLAVAVGVVAGVTFLS